MMGKNMDESSPPTTKLITSRELREAQDGVAVTCLRTPVLSVPHPAGGGPVWIKAESLQRTGSFKLRGAANALATLSPDENAKGVVTFSAGNHGRALAHAARKAGVAATVVMPETAPAFKIDATRALGATVVIRPPDDIVRHANQLAAAHGMTLVPPYDDARIIAGQGTVGLELLDQVDDVETVVVPVGGGGLIAGVAAAVKNHRPDARVIAVEPELAADLAEGYAVGERSVWSRALTGRTIADGLRSAAVGELAWAHITALVDEVVTVTEESIVSALRWLAEQAKLVVEPSGAVAAAALLEHPHLLGQGSVVAIATGGNIDLAAFAALVSDAPASASDASSERFQPNRHLAP
jgi:threonine dehydratase